MLNCNTYTTNAPIICNSCSEATQYGLQKQKELCFVNPFELLSVLKTASKTGQWCLVECDKVTTDDLRNAVVVVWLQGNWDHHPDFRAWFVYEPFMVPMTSQFTLDNTSNGFSLSPARVSSVASRLRIETANAHLPSSLIAGAVYLKYTSNFNDEFNIRSLVNAVGNSQLFYTKEYRHHLTVLQPKHIVGLFRLAAREDIFVALIELGLIDDTAKNAIVSARGEANESLIDIALKKEFVEAATLLRDLGCTSDAFDFNDLLKPSFSTALRVLLQPDKPFPFDPVVTARFVAERGNAEILRKLFFCRVDLNFEFSDYPLAEACRSESEEIVWIVLDRMGSTGVNPLSEPRWAFYHTLRIISETAVMASDAPSASYILCKTSLWLIRKLLDVVVDEGRRYHIPVDILSKAAGYTDIIQSLLLLLDPHAESNSPALLFFFASFDPNNALMEEVVRRAYRELPTRSLGKPIEEEVYSLLWHLLRQGPSAQQMLRVSIDCVVHYGYLDFTYRGNNGDTLLHKAIECSHLNLDSLGFMLYRLSDRDRINFICAENKEGCGGIEALVRSSITRSLPFEEEQSVANALRLLFYAGGNISIEKAIALYVSCVKTGHAQIAFELLKASGRPFDFASLPNKIALGMARRFRSAPVLGKEKFRTVLSLASDSLSRDEKKQVHADAGQDQYIGQVTHDIDIRLENNSLPFHGTATEQQFILSNIVDFLDCPSFNGFHDLCFATHFATMGRKKPDAPL